MKTDKEKLTVIINLEYKWHTLYDEYKSCYSISALDDFGKAYEDALHNLYISYFGEELGVLLNNYISDDIWDCYYDKMPIEETVNYIYDEYWPNPTEVIATLITRYEEEREKAEKAL